MQSHAETSVPPACEDAPVHGGVSLSFLMLISAACTLCVLRYMPEEFLAACRALWALEVLRGAAVLSS